MKLIVVIIAYTFIYDTNLTVLIKLTALCRAAFTASRRHRLPNSHRLDRKTLYGSKWGQG